MIHQQEKLELLTMQKDIASDLIENKIMSREWIYDNIFDFNEQDKKDVFEQLVEDQKQKFRFMQIEEEGNDPVESGEKDGDELEEQGDWGGSEKEFGNDERDYGNARAKDLSVAVNQLHSAIAYLDKSNYKLFTDSFPKTKGLVNAYADCHGLR